MVGLGEKVRGSVFSAGVSSYGCSQLMRWAGGGAIGKAEGKVVEIRCGLDRDVLRGEVSDTPDVKRLVSVGRFAEQKGVLVLLEAAGVLMRAGVVFELVMVGDGEMRGEVEGTIERLGLGDVVRLAGWKDGAGVMRELEGSRGLVMASFAEGLPVVLMEAMAAGRVVVTTWVAGIPELVVDGETGWLVAAGDVEGLAGAMREMLETPIERLNEMGGAGKARVAERHDVDDQAGLLVARWKRALGG